MRICSVCTDSQDDSEFKPQCNICKSCLVIHHKYRINNDLKSYLTLLFNTAKFHSKKRLNAGRTLAGKFSITLKDLQDLYVEQDGCCYYSGVELNPRQYSDWQLSLERLDPDEGYVLDNIALIAAEFQGSSQWSREKYKEFLKLMNANHYIRKIDWSKGSQKGSTIKQIKRCTIDNIEYVTCNYCDVKKTRENFGNRPAQGCKSCRFINSQAYKETPRGKFVSLLGGMRASNKRRGHGAITFKIEDLIDLWESQGGLCAYSKIPMNFGCYLRTDWVCSIERIDINLGYEVDNICFICHEFNTVDNTNRCRNPEEITGKTAWSPLKIEYIKSNASGCDTAP